MNKIHLFWILGGIGVGILGGFGYWFFIGCETGACPITSIWYNTSAYGGLMGGLLGSMMHGMLEKKQEKEGSEESGDT